MKTTKLKEENQDNKTTTASTKAKAVKKKNQDSKKVKQKIKADAVKNETKTASKTNNLHIDYLEERAEDLLKIAKEKGLNKNFVFNTTFNRYLTQIALLNQITKDFSKCESLVNKEYVKGRETITAHPLIAKINSTIDSANKTANLLVKMLTEKNLEIKEYVYTMADIDFMDNREIIEKLGTNIDKLEGKMEENNKRDLEELAEKIKNRYIKEHYGSLAKYVKTEFTL